jgi:cyclic pyranopterin phosphate synthase
MGMIDVTEKPIIRRMAEAGGKLFLSEKTMEAIRRGQIKKGDPLLVAEVAGMNAAKQTHLLIPHCHQIPLDTVSLEFRFLDQGIDATCRVRAQARTGVEMEALVGVTMALNTLWDMVKYLEKDKEGQYPHTRMTDIAVIHKKKGEG